MPFYNKLYETANFEFNPLYDTDITTTKTGGKEGSSNDNGTITTELETAKTSENTTADNENNSKEYTKNIETTGQNKNVANSESDKWDYYSDTPQGGITGIENKSYLTSARNTTDKTDSTNTLDTTSTTAETYGDDYNKQRSIESINNENIVNEGKELSSKTNTFNTTEEYIERITGKRGSYTYSKMIMEYREALLNVDMLIIEELESLFFQLWWGGKND